MTCYFVLVKYLEARISSGILQCFFGHSETPPGEKYIISTLTLGTYKAIIPGQGNAWRVRYFLISFTISYHFASFIFLKTTDLFLIMYYKTEFTAFFLIYAIINLCLSIIFAIR